MNLLRKISRLFTWRKPLNKLTVWTKDEAGRRFYYDILIFKLRRPGHYFVKFKRHSLGTGNKLQWHRVLDSAKVQELQLQAQ